MKRNIPSAYSTAAMAIVCLLLVAVRCWHLADSCLWFDEIFSIHVAGHPWDSLLGFVALDLIHPPLSYILLKLWIAAGGESLLWLRLFPVLFAVLAIFPFVSLCRELKLERWTQVLALFLFAVNGSAIKYSQEVRMYSPLMCLSLFSMWLFARYFVKGKSFVPLVIVNVLMVYTHYFGWFVIVTEVGMILWFQRIKWRPIMAMVGIGFAAFLPWLIAVLIAARGGSDVGQNIGWMSRPGPIEIGTFVLNLIEPFYFRTNSVEPVSVFLVSLPILIMLIAASIYLSVSIFRGTAETSTYFLLSFVKLPVWLCLVASWLLPYSIWGTRHLMIVAAPLSIFFAVAICSISGTKLRIMAAGALVLLCCLGFALETGRARPQNSWCAWEGLTQEMALQPHLSSQPRRLIATEDLIAYHAWFALRSFPNLEISVLSDLAGVREDKAYFLPRGFDRVKRLKAEDLNELDQFWVAYRDPNPPDIGPGIPHITIPPKVVTEFYYLGFEAAETKKVRVGSEDVLLSLLVRMPRALEPN